MIENLKDLEKLLKLLRKQGVTEFKLSGTEIKLGELPASEREAASQSISDEPTDPYANFPDRILSNEELIFFSAGGVPEDLPPQKDTQQ